MFSLTQTFTHSTGFKITPIEMEEIGFVFLPKELEDQLAYENLADMVRQSSSFAEGIEYLILRENKLLKLKRLLHSRNTIPEVSNSLNRTPSLLKGFALTHSFIPYQRFAHNAFKSPVQVEGAILPHDDWLVSLSMFTCGGYHKIR